jgi:large repetitive protein
MRYFGLRPWSALALCVLLPSTAAAQKLATGSGPGSVPPTVRIFDASGTESTLIPYPAGFAGGVRVALGDVNGDGQLDIVTGAGPGGGPHVRVWNGADLTEIWGIFAYDPAFPGGVSVAAGDVTGDGRADIITGAGPGATPWVRVWDGATFLEIASFFAYDPAFAGGVNVTSADVDGDGRADIITGAGPGGGPHVRVWSGVDSHEITGFFAYDPAFPGGVNVAAADIDGDGHADIITGAGPGGGPHVRVWSGADTHELTGFFAYDPAFPGGVVVATMDLDRDGRSEIITGPQTGAPLVRIWTGLTHDLMGQYWAFDPFTSGGGLSIGSSGGTSALRFTSATSTTFGVSTPGNFSVTTVGGSVPVLTMTGTLPSGVTFTDNTDRTGTLTGTPAASTGGSYPLTFTATSSGRPPVTQSFTLTVNQAPAITSAAAATFGLGGASTFTVTTTGFPAPTLSSTGALPTGVTFTPNSDGTATIAGTPAAGSGGTYTLTITASNGVGANATQTFVLTVNGSPAFTSANAATFTVSTPGSFTVTTVASPTASLSVSGSLPSGMTFVDNGNGTGTLSGTPGASTGGTHSLTFTATNSVGTTTQPFTLTVRQGPTITSAAATAFIVGMAGAFTVTTTGVPNPALTVAGALPTGVSFTDNGNGTATLAGTPAAATGGVYPLSITANNGVGSNAVQSFTLTVNQAPAFTTANATTFTVGALGNFVVATTGVPAVTTILRAGTLPTGVDFLDNGNGSGSLSGVPAVGTGGVYPFTLTINNGIGGNVVQNFTLTVTEAPAFTSAASTTFALGSPNTFTVTTSGQPTVTTITLGGAALPSGVTFVSNGNGTATLSGTPDPGTGGTYALTFTINNGIGGNVVQNFTLTVNSAPSITSANTTTFTVGSPGSFTLTTSGSPTPAIAVTGSLPSGVTFLDNGNGTGTLSGTPAAGTGGSYALTFTASNGVLPNGTQAFTLLVNQAPAITSAASTTFTVGSLGTFTVTTSGFPAPAIARGGAALPTGVTFTDNGNGTGTLSGTPAAGTGGTYAISFTATNTAGATAPQAFTFTVNQAPAITSANTVSFVVGQAGSFTVTTTGFPTPAVGRTGAALPGGVTFTDNGDGTGTLSGTPAAGTAAAYAFTFTATNGVSPSATQPFTLNVNQAPAITSAASTTFTVGTPGTFTVTTTGFPTPTVSQTGALPTGVTFTTATRVLAGTATQTGAFPLVFTATNGISPDATQNFTLNVVCPAITVTPSTMPDGLYLTAYSGVDFNQTGSTGTTFTWGATGLPAGLSIDTDTGVVSGTPSNTALTGSVTVTMTDNFGCQGSRITAITVRPTTDNETYNGGVGNTQFNVAFGSLSTPNVFVNDNVKTGDNGPGALSVTFDSPANGTVTEGTTDGTFLYTPNVGFAGLSDTFSYTLTDGNGVTNTGLVTINLSQVIWYVDNTYGGVNGTSDGRSHRPFTTLNAAQTPSLSGSTIFVHTGSGTTTGSLVMDASQLLWGQGEAFSLNSLVIPASLPPGTRPQLSGTVTLANDVGVRALNITSGGAGAAFSASGLIGTETITNVNVNGGNTGLDLASLGGTFNFVGGSFTSVNGTDVRIIGGSGTISIGGSIASTGGRSVEVASRSSGAVTFSGAISDSDQGISLTNNGTSTTTFMGGLTLNTGVNAAFVATGGGTVNVCALSSCTVGSPVVNTITTTSATALNVANTNIGSNGLTFRSISAGTGSGSAGVGISLNSTGLLAANGGLTVTGTGVSGSGGTIQHKTGADGSLTDGIGIVLQNTKNASFNWMQLNDFDNSAITGRTVNGFTLTNSVINGTIGTNSGPVEGPINFGLTNPGGTNGLQGTGLIRNTKVSGGIEHNLEFYNQSGSMTLTIDGVGAAGPSGDCRITSNSVASGSDGILIEMQDSSSATVTVQRCYFNDNKSQAIQVNSLNDTSVTVTLDSLVLARTTQGNEGLLLVNGGNSDMTAMVSNNVTSGFGGTHIFVGQTPGNATSLSQLHASVLNNNVTMPVTATNHGIIAFMTSTVGQVSQARLRIDGNVVANNSTSGTARGILVDTPDSGTSPTFHATVTNNSVSVADNVAGVSGLVVQSRQSATAFANIHSNTVTFPNGNPGVSGLRARQVAPASYSLEQNASCVGTADAVLACRNPSAATEVLGTITVVAAGSTLLPITP